MLVDARVEALAGLLAHVAGFERIDEALGRALDEEERRRLQRLDESLREAHREAIAVPVLRHASDAHLEMARGRRIVEHAEAFAQLSLRLVRRAERAPVDIAVPE